MNTMQIATITHIQPTGEPPYQSEHGALYSFIVTFDNNQSGKANSKSQTPPYKPGDRVGYEVTGNFKGMSIIKVSKNPDKAFGSAPAPQIQPPAQPRQPQVVQPHPSGPFYREIIPGEIEPLNPVNGASVGQSLNQALSLLTSGLTHDEIVERIAAPVFWYSVHEVASDVIRVARELEKGRLAPSPTERTKRATGLGSGLRGASAAHPQPDPRDSHPDLEPVTPDPF